MRLASYPLVQLADASWGLGRARTRKGRVDELLESRRELRHGGGDVDDWGGVRQWVVAGVLD